MENAVTVQQQAQLPSFNLFDKEQFATLQRICQLFANSELVPDIYRTTDKNPENKAVANCLIALEISQRTGASALMVMQNLVIIYGRPSWSSKFLIASVNTCGRFEPLQFKFTDKGLLGKVDYTEFVWDDSVKRKVAKISTFDGSKIQDIECICYTTKKGSDVVLESSPVSVKMAVQEGWYQKSGSKWATMTKQMLMYRSASFWTSSYSADISLGFKTTEEVHDIEDIDYEDVTNRVEKIISENETRKAISFNKEPEPVKEPAKEPAPTPAPTPAPAPKVVPKTVVKQPEPAPAPTPVKKEDEVPVASGPKINF